MNTFSRGARAAAEYLAKEISDENYTFVPQQTLYWDLADEIDRLDAPTD
jgi:ubiquinone biosynthesis protein UbiJ